MLAHRLGRVRELARGFRVEMHELHTKLAQQERRLRPACTVHAVQHSLDLSRADRLHIQ